MDSENHKLSRRSCLKKTGRLMLSAGFILSGINVYAEDDSGEPKCAACSLRAGYDADPKSLKGRIWKWHIRWCPGWKNYKAYLQDDERRKIMERYK